MGKYNNYSTPILNLLTLKSVFKRKQEKSQKEILNEQTKKLTKKDS